MPYPIVLAHGICRFDVLWNTALRVDDTDDITLDELHYFRGIRTMLRRRGHRVHHSRVAFGAKVDTRATQLGVNLQRILRDTRPQDLPIEQVSTFKLGVHLGTARAIGVRVPPTLLARADEVIE